MKVYWVSRGIVQLIFNLGTGGGRVGCEWLALCPGRFTFRKETLLPAEQEGYLYPKADLDALEVENKHCSCQVLNHGSL
jgi:hypothetical protein